MPDNRSAFVVSLYGAADVITDNTIGFTVLYLGRGYITVCVVNPGNDIVRRLRSVKRYPPVFGNDFLGAVRLDICPLVKDDIAGPQVAVDYSVGPLSALLLILKASPDHIL